jgi:signal transduction histidine kinase
VSKLKSEFISSVSHELRTPLTSIKGFSSLLIAEKFGALPPEAKSRLERIDQNVDKLVNMVNTLLDISRIESKRIDIQIAPADLSALVKDVKEMLTPQITRKQINLSIETPESLNVYMDKNLIERVFINIINNSIKFTPAQGSIVVKCTPKEDYVLVSIKDTGCGIEKYDLERIFQEFYRTKSATGIVGTGLGLSLVKKIIETHKEKIWVESEVNKGTSFFFTLKIAK